MLKKQEVHIRSKTYNREVLDNSAKRIVEVSKATGTQVSGPIPLPADEEVITILRLVHKHRGNREQFEQRTYERLIDIISLNQKAVDSLMKLNLPASVDIEIKL